MQQKSNYSIIYSWVKPPAALMVIKLNKSSKMGGGLYK